MVRMKCYVTAVLYEVNAMNDQGLVVIIVAIWLLCSIQQGIDIETLVSGCLYSF